ncbi:6524_t:CDS:1, partial [Funneliformis mosseae]
SGIGKSREMKSNSLFTHAEESLLANLTVEIESSKAALNDLIYIFIDLIDGHHAKERIGVHVAIAAGLIENTPNFIELYCFDNVIQAAVSKQ